MSTTMSGWLAGCCPTKRLMLTALSMLTGATCCASAGAAPQSPNATLATRCRLGNAGLGRGLFGNDSRDHWKRAGERADHLGVKLGARGVPQLAQRFVRGTSWTIRARIRHRIVRVGDMDDARGQRDVVANQPMPIRVAIRTLVVQLHDRNMSRQDRHRAQNPRAEHRVLFSGV